MLFQNVIRHTINLLAEAEREAALQQRLRGNGSTGDRSTAHHMATEHGHARTRFADSSDRASNRMHRHPPQ